jgi:hypothetical protein
MANSALKIVVCALFASRALLSQCFAASSFSSESHRTVHTAPTGQAQYLKKNYSGARIWSEDDKTFYFQAFGCQFRVDAQILGTDDGSKFVRLQNVKRESRFQGDDNWKDFQIEMVAKLVDAKRVDLSERLPERFECSSSRLISMISIMRRRAATGSSFYIEMTQDKLTKLEKPIQWEGQTWYHSTDQVGEHLFFMTKDLLSPQQWQGALRNSGDIGLAILRAIARR